MRLFSTLFSLLVMVCALLFAPARANLRMGPAGLGVLPAVTVRSATLPALNESALCANYLICERIYYANQDTGQNYTKHRGRVNLWTNDRSAAGAQRPARP